MPSTYTLNNGIELIGTGEQSGTWGSTTNTNLELLDTALDGQVTVTLSSTGSSGSPNALPISDGSNSDGRNRLIIFNDGSDLGGTAYVQLTPNDAEKIIYVRNSLSGSRSILLFQGTYNASNDYEVPAGTTAVVFFNGAGTGAVAANVFNNAYFDSLRLGGVSVDKILDEDNMASNDAAALATQQSIKAYVDTQVGANNELSEVLANGNTTGGTDIAVSTGDDITFADSSKAIFGDGSDLQITHSGSAGTITNATGGFTIDSAANIILDPDGGNVLLKDNGVEFGRLNSDSGDLILYTDTQDKHIILKGNDGGSAVNALDLDMENAGFATFNAGVVINNSGGEHNFQVKSDDNADMFRVSGAEDKVMVGTSSTSTQTVETGYVAKLSVKTGVSIFHDLQASGEDRYPLNLDSSGSWAGTGNVGTYTSLRWSNGLSQQMGEIGLRYGSAQTTTGANSEVSIRGLFHTNYGNSGEIVSFGANKYSIFQGGIKVNAGSSTNDTIFETDDNSRMIHIDGAEDYVAIGGQLNTTNANITVNANDTAVYATNTLDAGGGLSIYKHTSTQTNNDSVGLIFRITTDNAASNALGAIRYVQPAYNTFAGQMVFQTRNFNGTYYEQLRLDSQNGTLFNSQEDSFLDFKINSDSHAPFFNLNAGTNKLKIGSLQTSDVGTLVTIAGSYTQTFSSSNVEGELGLGLINNSQGNGQHSSIKFQVSANNGSNNAMGAIGLRQPSYTSHNSQLNFQLRSQSQNYIRNYLVIDSEVGAIFNPEREANQDFTVKGDTKDSLFIVDAGAESVNVNTSSTSRGDLNIGGMLNFEPGGRSWSSTNPRPTIKREADGQIRISAGSDSDSRITFYTAPSSGGTLVNRMEIDRNGELFSPPVIRSKNNSSVYFGKHTDAVSLPNSTDTIVATLTKTGYAYYLAGEFRLVIYDSSSPWGVYNYNQTISGKTSTHTGGGMGVGLGTAEIVSRLDYTPTVTLVDNRATGGESTATWQIKVNPGTNGPANALTIFQGYMSGATWT